MASREGLLSGIRLRSHRRLDSLHFPAPYWPHIPRTCCCLCKVSTSTSIFILPSARSLAVRRHILPQTRGTDCIPARSRLTMSTATPPTSNVRHWARKHAHNSVSDELALALYTRVKGAFVLSDPTLPDTPLVYVSPGFEKMSGYSAAECLGRNCRFLQGPETDQEEVRRIREAVEGKKAVSAHLLNFRKDGTPFINSLHIAPVHSASGSTKFFAGVQLDPGAFVDDSGIAIFRSWS